MVIGIKNNFFKTTLTDWFSYMADQPLCWSDIVRALLEHSNPHCSPGNFWQDNSYEVMFIILLPDRAKRASKTIYSDIAGLLKELYKTHFVQARSLKIQMCYFFSLSFFRNCHIHVIHYTFQTTH